MDMIIEGLKAFVLGIVEGITEWLPISSTGHMILVDEFLKLNVSEDFLALFLVVIQIGAIMAVIILYFHKLNPLSPRKSPAEKRGTWRLWGMVIIGCIPAAIIGLLFDDWVHDRFYGPWTVAIALIVYGVVFIIIEYRNRRKVAAALDTPHYKKGSFEAGLDELKQINGNVEGDPAGIFKYETVDDIDWKIALKIGLFQCLAIIPGTSRSGSTIIGGMLFGTSRIAATEFTFFLAVPIMLGWGLVKALKFFIKGLAMTQVEIVVLVVGILTSFIVSIISIKFLMGYIKKNDFAVFGWYRIIVGIIVLAYFSAKMMGII